MLYLLSLNPILIAAAVIPAILLLIRVYRADRLDKEPPSLLITLVLLGILATALATITEKAGVFLLEKLGNPRTYLYYVIMYFGVVACSEEGFKYLVLNRRTWNSASFNCQFDGVVYAVFVSLGFALWENINYVLSYGFGTALIRAVTAVPGHACFGVFMGTWYGLAKRHEAFGNVEASRACRVLGFVIPALLHGAYDYIASMDSGDGISGLFIGFVVVLFILSFFLVRKMSREDRYIDNPSSRYF